MANQPLIPPAGTPVHLIAKNSEYQGTILPSEDDSFVVLKLDNGYNVGLKRESITTISITNQKPPQKSSSQKTKLAVKKGLPRISILHTGGTIASKVDYTTGAVTARFDPQELLALFPELNSIATIDSRLVHQIMSENIRFAHYNLLLKEIEKEVVKGVDGIIVTHGTDTLHYTSAALAFGLEGLSLPVVLVGAQRSSDRGSSDAALNLLSAALFITTTKTPGVFVCMHESLHDTTCYVLSGTKARKMHTSRRDAFRPINTPPVARVDYPSKTVTLLAQAQQNAPDKKLVIKPFKENLKVGLLKVHTNMYACEFDAYKGFDGLVIEGTALGHVPVETVDEYTQEGKNILSSLKQLSKNMPVAMASQSFYGRVDMNVYSGGRTNLSLGILGNYTDMTPETAYIKLSWLLSNYKEEDVRTLYEQNVRGEISERLEEDAFLR